ncbi:MAG: histidinol-phosphate transaminase [Candidatus Latescibacteria bacterium]|nr:histidinol-phosphate transaminase [Candidatus Latescibacterota bacterium]
MNADFLHTIKPGIRAMKGYTLVQPVCPIKLNQNECPFDVPVDLKRDILAEAAGRDWGRYPDFVPTAVKAKIGAYNGVAPDGVLIGNGSNELIQATFIATVSKGDRVVLAVPTFTLYGLMSTAMDGELCPVRLRPDLSFDVDRLVAEAGHPGTKLVILCSPNNPTGSFITPDDVARIADATPGLVVVDEAYHEFAGLTNIGLLARYPNLVITRTFSKALGAAGLRIGYLIARPEIAREIEKVKLPYNVNQVSLIAAMRLLDERALIEERVGFIRAERQRVFERLSRTEGVRPFPSVANFILFEVDRDVRQVFHGLIERGVLIRDVSHYPMLDRAMRVTIGLEAENEAFLKALEKVMTQTRS